MSRLKVFIYLTLIFVVQNAAAQIDSVTFSVEKDVSVFRIICQAQKVETIGGVITATNFESTDTVNSAYTIDWGGDQEPVTDGKPTAIFEFLSAGTYTINLSVYEDATGSTYTENRVIPIVDEIIIPNVFTPGFDGHNDLFVIKANGTVPLEISIYSRTGTLVHQSKAPIIVWDGRDSSGSFVSQGVYYYILSSADPAVETKKGFVHVYYNKDDLTR